MGEEGVDDEVLVLGNMDTGSEVNFDDTVSLFPVEHVDGEDVERIIRKELLRALVEFRMTKTIVIVIMDSNKRTDSMIPRDILRSVFRDIL